jgi:hypothetical protein
MFEIILLAYLSYRNGMMAKQKSQNVGAWVFYTVIAFLVTMMIGIIFVVTNFCKEVSLDSLAAMDSKSRDAAAQQIVQVLYSKPLNLVTIELFGFGGYLFIRYLLEKKPGKNKPEVNWMDKG